MAARAFAEASRSTPSAPTAQRSDAVVNTPGANVAASELRAPTSAPAVSTMSNSSRPTTLAAANPIDLGRFVGDVTRSIGAQGDYRVALALHPDSLGTVHATISLSGNELTVAITPDSREGHEALAHELESLRGELSRGGMNVNVALHDHQSPRGQRESGTPARPGPVFETANSAPVDPTGAASDGQIHVIL